MAVVASLLAVALLPGMGTRCHAGRSSSVQMKGRFGYRAFSMGMWYSDDDFLNKSDELWVSPWAEAHHKIRQQEVEIERCNLALKSAIEDEDYEAADGLKTRVERLRSQHPIIPREERLQAAVAEGDFEMAHIFQKDLDTIKTNLRVPRFAIGQAVEHAHRTQPLRGVVIDVDLTCKQSQQWVYDAGCIERALAKGHPPEECDPDELEGWKLQPFYTVLIDLDDAELGPAELAAWGRDPHKEANPPPLYISQDALAVHHDDWRMRHPDIDSLFDGHAFYEHRGRVYQPSPALRLWQQDRAQQRQAAERAQRAKRL